MYELIVFESLSALANIVFVLNQMFVGSELLNQMFPLIKPNHFAQM